jgi:type IV secretory pathway TrbD component
MQVVKAGTLYFALVFGMGFVLGAIRTLWVVPRLGARRAELMEMPIMLAVTIVAARWIVLRFSVAMMWSARLGMGCIALVLMLVAEFGFVLWIRGISIRDYLATRDPVSGTAYYVMLVVFAVMPLVVARR